MAGSHESISEAPYFLLFIFCILCNDLSWTDEEKGWGGKSKKCQDGPGGLRGLKTALGRSYTLQRISLRGGHGLGGEMDEVLQTGCWKWRAPKMALQNVFVVENRLNQYLFILFSF